MEAQASDQGSVVAEEEERVQRRQRVRRVVLVLRGWLSGFGLKMMAEDGEVGIATRERIG